MNKNTYLIISLFFLATIFTSYYFVSAAPVGTPNPGHLWAEMQCSADSVCVDTSLNKVGVGTNSPAAKLHVIGNIIADNPTENNHVATKAYVDSTVSGSSSKWTLSGTNIYNSNSGNVGIGTNNPTEKFHVAGNVYTSGNATVGGNVTATGFYYTSDIRLKDNINPLTDSLSKILKLEGISYTLQNTKEDMLGFSAQELQKVYPELVKVGNDGYLSIDGAGLIAPLVEAIKEQQTMIESQQKEINELKDIINNLE